MNRHDRRQHGAYTRRWDTARRTPRSVRLTEHAWTTGLAAYVDGHGTPVKPNVGQRSLLRRVRDLRLAQFCPPDRAAA